MWSLAYVTFSVLFASALTPYFLCLFVCSILEKVTEELTGERQPLASTVNSLMKEVIIVFKAVSYLVVASQLFYI